jgi:hypothetical protein
MEYLNNLLNSNTQSGGVYAVSMHQLNQILQLSSAYFNHFDDNTKQQYIKLFGFTPLSLLKGHSSSKMPQYRERFIFLIYLQFCVLLMMNNTVGMETKEEVLEYLSKLCTEFKIDDKNPICSKIKEMLDEPKKKAEEEARVKAEEEARVKAEEEAIVKAEEETRLKAEEEARLKAEEAAKEQAEEARLNAEEEKKSAEMIKICDILLVKGIGQGVLPKSSWVPAVERLKSTENVKNSLRVHVLSQISDYVEYSESGDDLVINEEKIEDNYDNIGNKIQSLSNDGKIFGGSYNNIDITNTLQDIF